VFVSRVLRRILGPEGDEETGDWRNCIMKSSIISAFHQLLLGLSNEGG
jgi:hypothetical protein